MTYSFSVIGRLEMSVTECIQQYVTLSYSIFSHRNRKLGIFPGRYLFDARQLCRAIDVVVGLKVNTENGEKVTMGNKSSPKVFVVAVAESGLGGLPKLLRSYDVDDEKAAMCTITEAGWATSAAPTFFKPAKIVIYPGLSDNESLKAKYG